MEMTEKYLDTMTLIADFWIADNNNDIKSFANEGIGIQKSKTYLNKYEISIIVSSAHYGQMELFAKGWEKKYPKVVLTKGSQRVEAYDLLKLKGVREVGEKTVLEFMGELIK
jgi:ABC-type phosphate transport system substrate-binding protein